MKVRRLIREYVRELLKEVGPIAYDDTMGMVSFTRPPVDIDFVQGDFERNNFANVVRRAYGAAKETDEEPDLARLATRMKNDRRRLMGIDIDDDDLDAELEFAKKDVEEYEDFTPEEKVRYYADPRWYTRFF